MDSRHVKIKVVMLLLSVDLVLKTTVVTTLVVVLVDQVSFQDWYSIYRYFLVAITFISFILVMYVLQLLLASDLVLETEVAMRRVRINLIHTFECTAYHLLTPHLGLTT